MSKFVTEYDLNEDLIIEKAGYSSSYEGFHLFKCPSCQTIFLFSDEHDAIFIEPSDLTIFAPDHGPFYCPHCRYTFSDHTYIGERADEKYRVTFDELKQSNWQWVLNPEAEHKHTSKE